MTSLPLTRELITGSSWLIFHDEEIPSSGETFFYDSGLTGGMRLAHYARWKLADGTLTLLDGHERSVICLDHVESSDGIVTLRGRFHSDELNTETLTMRQYRRLDARRILATLPQAGQFRHLQEYLSDQYAGDYGRWSIGAYSYGSPTVLEPALANLKVGRFVSIGWGVNLALGGHRISGVSSYPFAAMRQFWPAATLGSSHDTKGDIVIGNDVWIGANAFIGSGLTIGDGAVIAANASVVKDVPPYAVVVGNSSRVIRHRFSPDVIERMLQVRWWDWDDEVIAAAMPAMTSHDVQDFFDFCDIHDLH